MVAFVKILGGCARRTVARRLSALPDLMPKPETNVTGTVDSYIYCLQYSQRITGLVMCLRFFFRGCVGSTTAIRVVPSCHRRHRPAPHIKVFAFRSHVGIAAQKAARNLAAGVLPPALQVGLVQRWQPGTQCLKITPPKTEVTSAVQPVFRSPNSSFHLESARPRQSTAVTS